MFRKMSVAPQTPTELQLANKFGVRLLAPFKLYPYQEECVQWIKDREAGVVTNPNFDVSKRGCLCAMVMGLGKTIIILNVIASSIVEQRLAKSCSLYVCPKTLLGTVQYEFEKFFGSQLKVQVYHRDFLKVSYSTFSKDDIAGCDVIITSYETILARYTSVEAHQGQTSDFMDFRWFRIILDESHWIRSKKTKLFKACSALVSPRRVCMTGTPIHNTLADLFHQLQFTGLIVPRGVKCNKAALRSLNLMQMVRFVDFKDAVDVRLPPITFSHEYFILSPTERKLHDLFMNRARRTFRMCQGGQGIRGYTGMFRVMQICSAPYLVTPESKHDYLDLEPGLVVKPAEDQDPSEPVLDESDPDMESDTEGLPLDLETSSIQAFLKDRDGHAGVNSSKMQAFRRLITSVNAANPHEKVVVFANFAATLRLLKDSLGTLKNRAVLVHGKIASSKIRENILNTFRRDPNITILLMTLKLGNVGLNLTEASRVIFFESWYSGAAFAQGWCRVHRIGQVRPVTVHYMIAKDSIEENIYRIAMGKMEMAIDISQEKQTEKLGVTDLEMILFGNESQRCMSDVSASEDEDANMM